MRWFKNLPTTAKLLTGFIIVNVIMVVIGWNGISNMGTINDNIENVYDVQLLPIKALCDMRGILHQIRRHSYSTLVLTDPEDSDLLEDDEILVCRITDPAWAPAFYLAAAVVIDVGGLSSHGAIVCREMGLPCVINTVNGTGIIRTGDRIRVDGDNGVVTILK